MSEVEIASEEERARLYKDWPGGIVCGSCCYNSHGDCVDPGCDCHKGPQCPTCGGRRTALRFGLEPCPTCNGSGSKKEVLDGTR